MRGICWLVAPAASLTLAACSNASVAPKKEPGPVPAAELRRMLPGHFLDQRPYPCDAGPLALRVNGTFISYNGWQDVEGTYRIGDGAVDFSPTSASGWQSFRIRFKRDTRGHIRFIDTSEQERELVLAPIDADTPFLTCGQDKAPPPPPGNGG